MSRKKVARRKGGGGKSFGQTAIDSLRQFLDAADRGQPITARTVKLDLEPKTYSGDEVRQLRERLGASQSLFAQLLAISVKTVQAWESGTNDVPSWACQIFDDVTVDPGDWLKRRLSRSSKRNQARFIERERVA